MFHLEYLDFLNVMGDTSKAFLEVLNHHLFTDVRKTFAGIIDALSAHMEELKTAGIVVFVRRGGPNEKEGLALMEKFLKQHDIYGSIHGSDEVLTIVVDEALEHVDA
jgi:succinyl-CoA synthetase beta subunit